MAEKTIICVKGNQWFAKTPKAGKRDALKTRLESEGYTIKKEVKAPSISTLEKWSNDGVCKSLMGKRVEPDGHDSDGSPSWLLALGFI